MARPGISKQEVFTAANQLLGEGKDPTIEQIRQILKTGSNSTIAGHLRDWRATQSDAQAMAMNEGIPPDIVSVVKGLWERINTQAGMKVEEIEETAYRAISKLQQELDKYKNNNRRWQKLFSSWQQEKAQLNSDNKLLEENIDALQAKFKTQSEQLQEKRMRIEELHRLHTQSQKNIENLFEKQLHDLQHENKALAQEKWQLMQEKAELEGRLKQINEVAWQTA